MFNYEYFIQHIDFLFWISCWTMLIWYPQKLYFILVLRDPITDNIFSSDKRLLLCVTISPLEWRRQGVILIARRIPRVQYDRLKTKCLFLVALPPQFHPLLILTLVPWWTLIFPRDRYTAPPMAFDHPSNTNRIHPDVSFELRQKELVHIAFICCAPTSWNDLMSLLIWIKGVNFVGSLHKQPFFILCLYPLNQRHKLTEGFWNQLAKPADVPFPHLAN